MALRSFSLIVLLVILSSVRSSAGSSENGSRGSLHRIRGTAVYRPFLINDVFNYYGNNGDGSFNRFNSNNEGFEFPIGTGKTVVFEDGLVWAGYHKGRLVPKAGGSVYLHALQPGPILQYGTSSTDPVPADPSDPSYRIYRVRPDVNPSVPFASVSDIIASGEVAYIDRYESLTAMDIYSQYVNDWNEWPAALGAPFSYGTGPDGNQRMAPAPYDPRFDIPGRPGADQTLWYTSNDLDSAAVASLTGSPPIGLEMQRTIWGYRRPGALGQAIFMSTLLLNKSGAAVDSMYVGQWADPDIGDGMADYIGCDTLLNMGYGYKAIPTDALYGKFPPAVGFILLQGPVIPSPGDTATFKSHRKYGYRNLAMTSFTPGLKDLFPNGDIYTGAGGDALWYVALRGLMPYVDTPWVDPATGLPSKFPFSGDPATHSGWLPSFGPRDIRLTVNSGPFRFAAGDTQEIVVAHVAGLGADYLSSVTMLRAEAAGLRAVYNGSFVNAAPPAPPVVSVGQLDGEIVLSWSDSASVAATEIPVHQGYAFEGYNVYEYASSSGLLPSRLATYDIVDGIKAIADTVFDESTGLYLTDVVERGTDSGILRSIDIRKSVISNLPLANGTPYYFGVTAYSYSGSSSSFIGSHSIESSPRILTVVPQSTNPGTRYNQSRGDTIPVTMTVAPGFPHSDGSVVPTVVDPTRITGDTYAVTFAYDTVQRVLTWGIRDQTSNRSLVSGLTGQYGGGDSPIVDGIRVEVYTPAPGMKSGDQYSYPGDSAAWGWYIPSGSRKWSPAGADTLDIYHLEGFTYGGAYSGAIGNAFDHWYSGGVTYDKLANVLIKFAATDSTWNVSAPPPDANFSRGYRYVRHATDQSTFAAHPGWSALIPNKSGGYAYQDYNYSIPFSAWNMDVKPPVRLAVGHLENNAPGGFVDGKWWPPYILMPGADNAGTQREFWFIFDAPYTDPAPIPALTVDILNNATPMMWFGMPDMRQNSYSGGDEFMIIASHANAPADTFKFTPKAPTLGDPGIARVDVTKINVFPNPYHSFDIGDPGRLTQVVTFTHLPQRAIIRIYTLAGVMVKSIQKDDPGQFLAWDLKNESGRPVASGMYLVYIQMPDLGSTKTLKLGILAEKQQM